MITHYCSSPTNPGIEGEEQPSKEIYDYAGCLYPEGIFDLNMMCYFNHTQIDKICFIGYQTEAQKKYCDDLNKRYEYIKLKKQVEGK